MTEHARTPPPHPGRVLEQEFLQRLGITQYRVAKDTGVPPRRINEIVQEKRAITPDTALRLARYFGTNDDYWLNLQAKYDLDATRRELGNRLQHEVKPIDKTARGQKR